MTNTNMLWKPKCVYLENTSMPTPSDVYKDMQDIIGRPFVGVLWSHLSWIEIRYKQTFKRSPDYKSVGVEDIEGLVRKMHGKRMVLLSEHPESKETYIMSTRHLELRQKGSLKLIVRQLLSKHGGEIPLSSFEDKYKKMFKVKLNYHVYGLTGLSHLCEVLNLVVEEANSPGEKVIKAGNDMILREKGHLKHTVQELLSKHGGEIPLSSFEDKYKDMFKEELIYQDYGLTGLSHLCEVLNLVVEEANSPGEEVIKAGQIYNLRKRKK